MLYRISHVYSQGLRPRQGLEYARRAIMVKEKPSLLVIHVYAYCLYALGRDDEAEVIIDRALAVPYYDHNKERAGYMSLLQCKARILRACGKLEEALPLLEAVAPFDNNRRAAGRGKHFWGHWFKLADMYDSLGMMDKAVECDKKVSEKRETGTNLFFVQLGRLAVMISWSVPSLWMCTRYAIRRPVLPPLRAWCCHLEDYSDFQLMPLSPEGMLRKHSLSL